MYTILVVIHSMQRMATCLCGIWDVTEGERGAQELDTCVVKHLEANAKDHERVILYSDCCGGQNRNIKMALSLLKYVNNSNNKTKITEHKFLESGYSYLPNDSDFGLVEKKAHQQREILFDDWVDIAKTAKRKPFQVTVMQYDDLLSTQLLENSVTKQKRTVDRKDINWLKIKWLRFERGPSFTIKFKETHNSDIDFYSISLNKSQGRPLSSFAVVGQEKLYTTRGKSNRTEEKGYDGFIPFISPSQHAFFINLPVPVNTKSGQKHHASNNEQDYSDDEPLYDI